MNEDLKETIISIIACLIALIFGVFIGCDAGMNYQKRQAVKAGAAVWGADSEGSVRIEYIKREVK